jgi:hypothetical protein
MAQIIHIQHGDIFWHLFLGPHIFVRNFKMQTILHILEEQAQKKKKQKTFNQMNCNRPNAQTKLLLLMVWRIYIPCKNRQTFEYVLILRKVF